MFVSLAFKLRPFDIAPKAQQYDPDSGTSQKLVFCTDQVIITENGGVRINYLGTKNDTSRDGLSVEIPPSSNSKLHPVFCLKCYMKRTDSVRPKDNPVFEKNRKTPWTQMEY